MQKMREKGKELKRGDIKWVKNPKRNICGTIRILSENFTKLGPAVFEKLHGHKDRHTYRHTHTHKLKWERVKVNHNRLNHLNDCATNSPYIHTYTYLP